MTRRRKERKRRRAMSKIIRITDEMVDNLRDEIRIKTLGKQMLDGTLSFSKTFTSDEKATLYFTEEAWIKMNHLVATYDKEVAWHGTAFRGEDPEKNEYTVEDILVYPQKVTGGTVTVDLEKYTQWIIDRNEAGDPRMMNLRMQGHSHVNMATSPSTTDMDHQKGIVSGLEDDGFYIFVIWNKRGEHNIRIYDMAKNLTFEPADVTLAILPGVYNMAEFQKDADQYVEKYTYQAPSSQYGGNYGGYNGGYNGSYKGSTGSTTPAAPAAPAKPAELPPSPAAKTEPVKTEPPKTMNNSYGKKKTMITDYDDYSEYADMFDGYDPSDPFDYRDGIHSYR